MKKALFIWLICSNVIFATSMSVFADINMDSYSNTRNDTISTQDIALTNLNYKEKNTQKILHTKVNENAHINRFYQLEGIIGDKDTKEVRAWAYYELVDNNKILHLTLLESSIKDSKKRQIPNIKELKISSNSNECNGFTIQGIWQSNKIVNNYQKLEFENIDSSFNGDKFYFCESKIKYSNINIANFNIEEIAQSKVGQNPRFFNYSFSVPFIEGNRKFNESFYPQFVETIQKTFEIENRKMHGLCDNCNSVKELSNANVYSARNEVDINFDFRNLLNIGYIDSKIIVFNEVVYSYTGGAHGNSYYGSRLYDLESKDFLMLQIDDIFVKSDELLKLIDKKLKETIDANMLFEPDKPLNTMPSSFQIDSDNFIFIYNTYEIAPYSSGAIKIKFKFYELTNHVKNTGFIAYLFNAIPQ
ncbi:RsiV family protein [Helicobacter ibis]|uniref:RsiV family protein n=1 Tax=Helicobacter ibis TaxID=2962633 RepID=A0ABT4VDC2_9HELI|nr:RsiV family protein [Helicobacter ibis]MDA3968702.1 RsiV family protein [Helicobacter ibis]